MKALSKWDLVLFVNFELLLDSKFVVDRMETFVVRPIAFGGMLERPVNMVTFLDSAVSKVTFLDCAVNMETF